MILGMSGSYNAGDQRSGTAFEPAEGGLWKSRCRLHSGPRSGHVLIDVPLLKVLEPSPQTLPPRPPSDLLGRPDHAIQPQTGAVSLGLHRRGLDLWPGLPALAGPGRRGVAAGRARSAVRRVRTTHRPPHSVRVLKLDAPTRPRRARGARSLRSGRCGWSSRL